MHSRPILVVDDDDDVRNMLCAVLAAEGYPVVGAADGIEALTRMRHNPPALAVVDMMMPRMDGEELIRAMSQDNYLVSLVGNHKLATRTRITSSSPFPFAFDHVPVEVPLDLHETLAKAAAEEVAKKVRPKRRLFPFFGEKAPSVAPDDTLTMSLLDEDDGKDGEPT